MTAIDFKLKLGFVAAMLQCVAFGWAHGLRTVGELGAASFAVGALVPLAALLLGMLASLLLFLGLLLPFTLREDTIDGLQPVFDWGAWLVVHAAVTFGVVAAVTRVVGPSAPPDLRLWTLAGLLLRSAGVVVVGWLALQTLREVVRRAATARDLRAARGLALAGQVEAALERCADGLERWEQRPFHRSGAAFELALLRAQLHARRSPQEGAGAFADLAEELAWSPDHVDRIAREADATSLPTSGLQAWMLAVRPDPATRDRALDEVARRAEALGAADPKSALHASVFTWLRGQVVKARERRDGADLEALARLAERLGSPSLASQARAERS